MNPIHERMLSYFEYDHLPEPLQEVSKPFADLARKIAERHVSHDTDGAESTVALRKLLEAKDCAVRAALS